MLPATITHAKLQVEPRTALPLYSIGLSTVISLLLALINIGSIAAFSALTSLTIAAFYSTFVISAVVMLHKRLTVSNDKIGWGPFKLGRAGTPITIFAIIYSVIGIFFSFWPATIQVTAQSMNWSVAVFGGVLIFSMVFWVAHGRKIYKGPILEVF
jgi:choline transport protein